LGADFVPDRIFGELKDCMEFLADNYARAHPAVDLLPSGLAVPDTVPAYLFRGECGCYPTTLPALFRESTYPASGLQTSDRTALQHLESWLVHRFMQADYGLNLWQATALLQHYGLPTQMLDFTAHSGYAAAFTVAGKSDIGRICVFPFGAPGCTAVDLADHPWAERPQKQDGYGVLMPLDSHDLKSNEARDSLGARWYEFPVSGRDRELILPEYVRLTGINDDASAGFLRCHVTDYVEAFGKLSSPLTSWLIERIPMVPRCYKVMSFDCSEVVVRHQPATLLGDNDNFREAEWSRRYWSTEYPESSLDRMTGWHWPAPGSLVADPRTYHPDRPD
jgi:FRG domain-containing protein